MTPELISLAADWPELAGDILKAIESLERTVVPTGGPGHILLKVAPDLQSLQAQWWDSQTGCPGEGSRVQLRFGEMPLTTDESRTEAQFAEPIAPPNATIDRAISRAAAASAIFSGSTLTIRPHPAEGRKYWIASPRLLNNRVLAWAGSQSTIPASNCTPYPHAWQLGKEVLDLLSDGAYWLLLQDPDPCLASLYSLTPGSGDCLAVGDEQLSEFEPLQKAARHLLLALRPQLEDCPPDSGPGFHAGGAATLEALAFSGCTASSL